MALAHRTYSFRAPTGLDDRLATARHTYAELAAEPGMATHISRELELGLQRRLLDTPEPTRPSWLLRAISEAFVDAVERAAGEAAAIAELRSFDDADRAGVAERGALLRASTLGHDD